ncbi:YraN family protein [Microbacterium immunditiarum]|uniref:UPF0102 protein BJ991_002175 n=1 Tax=Microbacterium immunditiarum TaxID=337480 RepID=A0A7Y9GP82_9MICO|nr:YraN family protein [Microbacterium immunditiarum]NYE20147.1 putative endonuclease [Microbacterium immunditiarum]
MADKDVLGRAGEHRAALYLESRGYAVLDRNWRCKEGELDIVVADDRTLVVVEVKTRRSDGFGDPLEAVDARKRRRLWRLAMAWIAAHPDEVQRRQVRLDAIGLTGPDAATARLDHLEDIR